MQGASWYLQSKVLCTALNEEMFLEMKKCDVTINLMRNVIAFDFDLNMLKNSLSVSHPLSLYPTLPYTTLNYPSPPCSLSLPIECHPLRPVAQTTPAPPPSTAL
jgi:hypothetical protein